MQPAMEWPVTLRTFLGLLQAFQRSIIPSQGPWYSTHKAPVSLKNFKFATGASDSPNLLDAVRLCYTQAQEKLGARVRPDFCQLLVSAGTYGDAISQAPVNLRQHYGAVGWEPPVIIGGAVGGLMGLGQHVTPMSATQLSFGPSRGVSLMAAVLPGVELHPFHSRDTSLPALPWGRLLQTGNQGAVAGQGTAALLLSEPHFTQVGDLLGRMQGAIPGMPVIGGVLEPKAWGSFRGSERTLRGALFEGDDTHDEGAVGCIMTGPLQVDALCMNGCRPVGKTFRVTQAEGAVVMELDGQPAYPTLRDVHRTLPGVDRLMKVQLGLDVSCSGTNFVAFELQRCRNDAVHLGVAKVPNGAILQLLVRDPEWAQAELQQRLKGFVSELPPEVRSNPASLGAFLYSCAAVVHNEELVLNQELPRLEFQGTKVQGEFGRVHTHSLMQSYASSFGFLRQAVLTT